MDTEIRYLISNHKSWLYLNPCCLLLTGFYRDLLGTMSDIGRGQRELLESRTWSASCLRIDILPRLKTPPEIADFWCANETLGLVNAGIPRHRTAGLGSEGLQFTTCSCGENPRDNSYRETPGCVNQPVLLFPPKSGTGSELFSSLMSRRMFFALLTSALNAASHSPQTDRPRSTR